MCSCWLILQVLTRKVDTLDGEDQRAEQVNEHDYAGNNERVVRLEEALIADACASVDRDCYELSDHGNYERP